MLKYRPTDNLGTAKVQIHVAANITHMWGTVSLYGLGKHMLLWYMWGLGQHTLPGIVVGLCEVSDNTLSWS
jgi:hypothetical protein